MPTFAPNGRLIRRKDRNFFAKISVVTTTFIPAQRATWDFDSTGISLMTEGDKKTDIVQYSFDGQTVHGDLTPGLPSAAIIFDNRHENTIWFRRSSLGPAVIMRIESWRSDS